MCVCGGRGVKVCVLACEFAGCAYFEPRCQFCLSIAAVNSFFNMTQSCLHTHTHTHLTDLHANCTVKQLVLCHAPVHAAAAAATAKQLNIYATQAANKIRQRAAKGTKGAFVFDCSVYRVCMCARYVCVNTGHVYVCTGYVCVNEVYVLAAKCVFLLNF